MGGDTTWWLAAGIVLGTVLLASAAALSDTLRHRMHVRRQRSAPLPATLAIPTTGTLGAPPAGAYPAGLPPQAGAAPVVPAVPTPAAPASQVQPGVGRSPATAAPPQLVPRPPAPSVAASPPYVTPPAPPPARVPAAAQAALPPPEPPQASRVAAQAPVPPPVPPPASRVAGQIPVPPGVPAAAAPVPRSTQAPGSASTAQAPVPSAAASRAAAQVPVPPSTQVSPAPAQAAGAARVQPSAGSWVATPTRQDAVEVRLLGPLEVRAPGAAHGPYHTEAAGLVAMAAVLPTGVPADLVTELWPGPVGAAVAGRARDWLGLDTSGAPRLAERDRAWRLAADVRVDWHLFRALVNAPGSIEEAERLATALALIRGELLAGVPLPPAARQALEPHLAELRAAVVNAVHRDVALALAADDPARAEWALRQGRTLLPQEASLQRAESG